ncbi:MAG: type II toxin-antitoxin system prevent-host-death family antitoxin [Candidatus Thioglobus sp.]|nr:MAG: type II toxin-antitoxin system prevent-host-death family antitoxin [Candidatus Thioglobus sp.]
MLINLSAAKTNLSSLINRAYQGEKITIAKHNMPMVDLVAHKPKKGGLKLGLYKDDPSIMELAQLDWFAEDKELNDIVENGAIFPEE